MNPVGWCWSFQPEISPNGCFSVQPPIPPSDSDTGATLALHLQWAEQFGSVRNGARCILKSWSYLCAAITTTIILSHFLLPWHREVLELIIIWEETTTQAKHTGVRLQCKKIYKSNHDALCCCEMNQELGRELSLSFVVYFLHSTDSPLEPSL